MSRVGRRRYLVAYDISDDKRRDKVFSELHGFGDWAQFSVFLCELTHQELVRMRTMLSEVVHHRQDQVLILDLGPAQSPLENTLEVVGRGYEPAVRSFII